MTNKTSHNTQLIIERCTRIIKLTEQNAPQTIIDNEVNILTELTNDYKQYTSPVRLVLSPEEQEQHDKQQQKHIEELSENILQHMIDNNILKPKST